MPSAPAIGFDYRPSHRVREAHAVVAVLVVAALPLTALPWWAGAALALAVLGLALRGQRGFARPAALAACWNGDGTWTLRLANGDDAPATLAGFRVLGPYVLLRLRAEGGADATLILAPDNAPADTRRRLRVRLASGRGIAAATGF